MNKYCLHKTTVAQNLPAPNYSFRLESPPNRAEAGEAVTSMHARKPPLVCGTCLHAFTFLSFANPNRRSQASATHPQHARSPLKRVHPTMLCDWAIAFSLWLSPTLPRFWPPGSRGSLSRARTPSNRLPLFERKARYHHGTCPRDHTVVPTSCKLIQCCHFLQSGFPYRS